MFLSMTISSYQISPRFTSKDMDDYIFKPQFHKKIPADGYNMYTKSIWDKVLSNRDLDLPTQQELLAQYRCDEISNVIYKRFDRSAYNLLK